MSPPRKTGSPNPMSIKANDVDLFHSASNIALMQLLEQIDTLFDTYASEMTNLIEASGIEELCSDLKVGADDVRMLMLAWKMKAKKQGFITQDEWRRGLKALEANSLEKLQRALPALEREVMRPSNFKDFYAFAFRYSLTEERQKTLDIGSICLLLKIVLGSQFRPQVDSFTQYLQMQKEYKVLTFDQWMGFYQFCNEISFPDLNNYDDQLAWPLVLDSFVEWVGQKNN
ncbi:hypothetical protein PVL29_014523 [Vitis rotundifolia]|uniref:Defective in cullin neddylation protein n=1 Tax=Vitis rotundifolia TaxID=103349 RepID=A0AA38ZHC1_VITRO|nr:hypothetical protein PVL29_014523 [Vitis rotundifolia]